MANVLAVPEAADGGFWYVLPDFGDDSEAAPPAGPAGWCAWRGAVGGQTYVVLRSAAPLLVYGQTANVPVRAVLAAAGLGQSGKPYARIEGR